MIGRAPASAVRPAAPVSDGMALGIPVVTDGGHIRKLEEVEADMIRLALHRYRGQMSEVARKLGIGRSTLYRKMRDLGPRRGNWVTRRPILRPGVTAVQLNCHNADD